MSRSLMSTASSPLKLTMGMIGACHMSPPPNPPDRLDQKNSVEPSAGILGEASGERVP